MKLAKKFRPPVEPRSFGTGLIVGCFLVSMTYAVLSRNEIGTNGLKISFPLQQVSCLPSSLNDAAPESSVVESSRKMRLLPAGQRSETEISESTRIEAVDLREDSATAASPSDELVERRPICDRSGYRVDICDIRGDVRILGKNSSSVMLVAPPDAGSSKSSNESWQIKPYPRKYDFSAMSKVRALNLRSTSAGDDAEAPQCDVNHTVPGILFSTGGHCGNCFHDFADVLIPLFQTAGPFRGQVQFVITHFQGWWMNKYRPYLTRLSSYEVIDFDQDDRVHCFQHLIVGLRAGRDLMIDPSESPELSITDFVKLTMSSYSLERDRAWTAGASEKKPRLLFIARGGTRKFVNLDAMVAAAEEVGFEVVAEEPDFYNVARFAHVVNSCDVMVGVHGAGLTNFLFLPTDAVVIQVVPLGKLDWIAQNFYAEPAMGRNLRYLQYNLSVEESTLVDLYPRDHPVFKDPESIHKEGWFKLGDVYLKQQNVRVDVQRFSSVLVKAFELLHNK